MRPEAAAVRVPCSTSNLGPGFDTLGLALDRYLDARFHPSAEGGLTVARTGTLAELDVPDGDDLAVRAFRAGAEAAGWSPRGTLSLASEIPLARGLGSSAAARVAGHALAQVASGEALDPRDAFRAAADGEGHGDNAAPAALGGFRGVVDAPDGLRPSRWSSPRRSGSPTRPRPAGSRPGPPGKRFPPPSPTAPPSGRWAGWPPSSGGWPRRIRSWSASGCATSSTCRSASR